MQKMADAVREHRDEQDKWSSKLEEQVNSRTEEVQVANKSLRQEIEERRKVADDLRESLRVKELLSKEVHHRVANNRHEITRKVLLPKIKTGVNKSVTVAGPYQPTWLCRRLESTMS